MIDQDLVRKIESLAKDRGTSLSSLVEAFFEHLLSQKEAKVNDSWVISMDKFLKEAWEKKPERAFIEEEIQRDHDDFEQGLIDDLSEKFLP